LHNAADMEEDLIVELKNSLKRPTAESKLKINSLLNYLILKFVDTSIKLHKKKKRHSVVAHIERNITQIFSVADLQSSSV